MAEKEHHAVMDNSKVNSSTQGLPLSQRDTTTVTPGTLNVPIIVAGVFVPLILIVIIVVIIYVWYRRKYPVRMVIGKDFSRFSNPAYNKRASTMTLVRGEDVSVDMETNAYDNKGLELVREDDTDGTEVANKADAHDNAKGDGHRTAVNTEDKGSRTVEGAVATHIVRERPKRALLIKDDVEELDKDFDLVTESDLSQRTESEVSSGNDSTETHTISLNFSETFDLRQTLSKSVDDLSNHNVPKPSKSKSFGERSAPVDFDKLTENMKKSQSYHSETMYSPSPFKDGFRTNSLNGGKQVAFPSELTPKQDELYFKVTQNTSSGNVAEDDDCSSESNKSKEQKTKIRDSRIASMDLSTNNNHEFKIDPMLLNKKRLSLTLSAEKMFLENGPATPTVIVQDSIIYEPDSTSPVQLDTPTSTREKRSVTLGDLRPPEELRLREENMREWHSVGGFESAQRVETFKQSIGDNQKLGSETSVQNDVALDHSSKLPRQVSGFTTEDDFQVAVPIDTVDVSGIRNTIEEGKASDLMLILDQFEIPNEHSKCPTDPQPVVSIESAGSLASNELQKLPAESGDLSKSVNILDVLSSNLENVSSTNATEIPKSLGENVETLGYTALDDFIPSDVDPQTELAAGKDTKYECMDADVPIQSASVAQEKSQSERLKCISEGEEPADSSYDENFQNQFMSGDLYNVSNNFVALTEDDAQSCSVNGIAENSDGGEKRSAFGENDVSFIESLEMSLPDKVDLDPVTPPAEEQLSINRDHVIEDELQTVSVAENIKQEMESGHDFFTILEDTSSLDDEVDV